MDLINKKCVPCEGGVPPLSNQEIRQHMKETPEWEVAMDNKSIRREMSFRNFAGALEFVNQIGQIAEDDNHHPDIELGWGYCNITLQTHSINGLHENDFILAAKIDQLTI